MRISRVFFGVPYGFLALIFISGCATKIKETHILQAKDPVKVGETGYYRVTVKADADLAKTNYRAGLYDSEALDALLTGVDEEDPNAVDQVLERLRREAVSQIASKYYTALAETPEDGEHHLKKITELERRLAKALLSPYLIVQQSGAGTSVHPRRKFAVIYSALASQVEEAIANFAEAKATEDLVLTALASIKREDLIDAMVDAEVYDRALAVLKTVKESAESGVLTTDEVRRLLLDVSSIQIP